MVAATPARALQCALAVEVTPAGSAWRRGVDPSLPEEMLRAGLLPAEMLRVMSPSAEVQGHTPSQRVTVGGKRHVTIGDLRPVGSYAVRIVFSDGHDTGLFSWEYLEELGREKEQRWADYEAELADKGLSRD